ncbi:hypothetical protein, partial [Paraburkholderia ribeironis]|uniref:hypothetical protein n=1 Tax=Paraburkholderia ribeironis TaxID=1247936 RepID=UPI001C3F4FD7
VARFTAVLASPEKTKPHAPKNVGFVSSLKRRLGVAFFCLLTGIAWLSGCRFTVPIHLGLAA